MWSSIVNLFSTSRRDAPRGLSAAEMRKSDEPATSATKTPATETPEPHAPGLEKNALASSAGATDERTASISPFVSRESSVIPTSAWLDQTGLPEPVPSQTSVNPEAETAEQLSSRWAEARKRPVSSPSRVTFPQRHAVPEGAAVVPPERISSAAVHVATGHGTQAQERIASKNPAEELFGRRASNSNSGPLEEPDVAANEPRLADGQLPVDTAGHSSFQQEAQQPGSTPAELYASPSPSLAFPSGNNGGNEAEIVPRRFAMLRTVAEQWRVQTRTSRYLILVGTIPEARKLASLVIALRAQGGPGSRVLVCAAGDEPERVREALQSSGIAVDLNLTVTTAGLPLEQARTRLLKSISRILADAKPEWLVLYGDSAMAAMASIAAYYAKIPVARVDGGTPPHYADETEESNPEVLHRRIACLFASMHFAETDFGKEGLLQEGVPQENILITGSTRVDALHEACVRFGIPIASAPARSSGVVRVFLSMQAPTMGEAQITEICRAVKNLATSVPGLYEFVWPLQGDARSNKAAEDLLHRVPGVLLSGSAGYESFLRHLSQCDLVLTDTPDVQEEAPSLGKPVLLIKQTNDRPEAQRVGITRLTGNDAAGIQAGVRSLARKLSVRHGSITNPYGDGKATARMVDFFEGRPVREFGRATLPRLIASGSSISSQEALTVSTR